MPRDFRRFTTVDDLLDDGVENNSDLAARIARCDDDRDAQPTPDDPEVLRIREETIARVDREHAKAEDAAQQQSYSIIGVVIGLSLVIPGLAVLFHPVDMLVEHRRIRYLASVFEHITVGRSIFYCSFVVFFGLAIIYFSTRRFKK